MHLSDPHAGYIGIVSVFALTLYCVHDAGTWFEVENRLILGALATVAPASFVLWSAGAGLINDWCLRWLLQLSGIAVIMLLGSVFLVRGTRNKHEALISLRITSNVVGIWMVLCVIFDTTHNFLAVRHRFAEVSQALRAIHLWVVLDLAVMTLFFWVYALLLSMCWGDSLKNWGRLHPTPPPTGE